MKNDIVVIHIFIFSCDQISIVQSSYYRQGNQKYTFTLYMFKLFYSWYILHADFFMVGLMYSYVLPFLPATKNFCPVVRSINLTITSYQKAKNNSTNNLFKTTIYMQTWYKAAKSYWYSKLYYWVIMLFIHF